MEKMAVIYWSGTGNTEIMANAIAKGMQAAGAEVDVFSVGDFKGEIKEYSKVAFGCPSMGDEVLEECEFEPFFEGVERYISGKKVALFGSYGWGDGLWMRNWQKRVNDCNANLFREGLILNSTPDAAGEAQCEAFGSDFAKY